MTLTGDMKNAVGVMARFPVEGRTKTRLAADLGQSKALDIYGKCAGAVFHEVGALRDNVAKYVFFTGLASAAKAAAWTGPGFTVKPQVGRDLGQRLQNAFDFLFSAGADKAILLASDTPDISSLIITKALDALKSRDVVLGPSHDGGYYLIGMRTLHHELFIGIRWGSSEVLAHTVDRINSLGLTLHLLPELIDIDNAADYELWKSAHGHGAGRV
jgi:uncharacterized protein